MAEDFILPSTQRPREPVLEEGQERARDFRLPSQPEPVGYEKDWGKASWEEVGKGFKEQFVPSVRRAITAIPEAIMKPGETVEGFKQIGTGIASKVRGAFGEEKAPEQKMQDEAVINAIIEPFTSMAGFKKALATDPYSVLSVMAIPVSGGAAAAGAGAKAVGTASMAGKALRGAELAGKGTAMVMDPIYGAAKTVGAAYEGIAKPAAQTAISDISGVSRPAMETAFEAGRTSDKALKDAFNTYAKGQGKAEDFSQVVSKASTKMRDAEISEWASKKDNVLALRQVVPEQPILDALQEARKITQSANLGAGPAGVSIGPARKADEMINFLERKIANRLTMPPSSAGRTIEGFDLLKRELYELGENTSGMTSQVVKKVNSGVRKAMSEVSDDYVNLMEKYQGLNDKLKTIQKSLATGDNVSAVRELNTFIRGMDDLEKGRFIAELAKYDPRIPYMVAGASIHQAAGNPSNWGKALSIGQMANIGYGIHRGDPLHVVGAAGMLGAQKMFGSPQAVGKMTYTAGQMAPVVEPVAETVAGAARILPSQLSRMQNEPLMESVREGRATGGRVATADKLVGMVDRAKKNINNQTEELLKTPDSHVAQALEVANRHLEG